MTARHDNSSTAKRAHPNPPRKQTFFIKSELTSLRGLLQNPRFSTRVETPGNRRQGHEPTCCSRARWVALSLPWLQRCRVPSWVLHAGFSGVDRLGYVGPDRGRGRDLVGTGDVIIRILLHRHRQHLTAASSTIVHGLIASSFILHSRACCMRRN